MDIAEQLKYNRNVIDQFRSGGVIEDGRERTVLLTTVGRKTGQRRTTPLTFYDVDDRIVIVASDMGSPTHPAWFLNLLANPRVTLEFDDEHYEAVATPLEGRERELMWNDLTQRAPWLVEHQENTTRTLPVVALRRSAD